MSRKYNICEQCCLATNGCEKRASQCFYAAEYMERLVCPYCGHEVEEYYDLADLGLVGDGEVETTFNCDKCGNAMNVNSCPKYYITASPADESAVERAGHSDYTQEGANQ